MQAHQPQRGDAKASTPEVSNHPDDTQAIYDLFMKYVGRCHEDEQMLIELQDQTYALGRARGRLEGLSDIAPPQGAQVPDIDAMVSRLLAWPLPADVHADPCASIPGYPHRYGTNLLTAEQAKVMLEHVLAAPQPVAKEVGND